MSIEQERQVQRGMASGFIASGQAGEVAALVPAGNGMDSSDCPISGCQPHPIQVALDAAIKAAQERVHRSTGQRCRWALVAIKERVERERREMAPKEASHVDDSFAYLDGLRNAWPWSQAQFWGMHQAMPLSEAGNPWGWLLGNALPTLQASSVRQRSSVRQDA